MLINFIVLKSREKAKNHDSQGCTNLQNDYQRLQSEFTMKSTQYDQLNK